MGEKDKDVESEVERQKEMNESLDWSTNFAALLKFCLIS